MTKCYVRRKLKKRFISLFGTVERSGEKQGEDASKKKKGGKDLTKRRGAERDRKGCLAKKEKKKKSQSWQRVPSAKERSNAIRAPQSGR